MGDLKFRRKTKALIRRPETQLDREFKFFEINSLVK